jgi:hypothetical protein
MKGRSILPSYPNREVKAMEPAELEDLILKLTKRGVFKTSDGNGGWKLDKIKIKESIIIALTITILSCTGNWLVNDHTKVMKALSHLTAVNESVAQTQRSVISRINWWSDIMAPHFKVPCPEPLKQMSIPPQEGVR